MIFFALHGFASATPNRVSNFLHEHIQGDENHIVCLNYFFDAHAGISALTYQVTEAIKAYQDLDCVFVGCSLGGFMAHWLAYRFRGKAILVNPAIRPWESLDKYVGPNTNHKTGEHFTLTDENVRSFTQYEVPPDRVKPLVLLDMGDEVLNSAETVQYFAGKAQIITYEGGSHRFEHYDEAKEHIETYLCS